MRINRPGGFAMSAVALAIAAAGTGMAGSAAGGSAAGPVVPVVWEHRTASFAYIGETVPYACVSLEGQVRKILGYLGARQDMKVVASGCPGGPDVPSHRAWVSLDFYVPAPASAAAASASTPAPDAGVGRWKVLELSPHHPNFMSRADCNLLQGMKSVVMQSFTLRDLNYDALCFPGDSSDAAFSVRGAVLESASR